MPQAKSTLMRVRPATKEVAEEIAAAHRLTLIEAMAVMAECFASMSIAEQRRHISKQPANGLQREVAA